MRDCQDVITDIHSGKIEIDEPIKDIVIKLNELGYRTMSCCDGQGDDKFPYIEFLCHPEQFLNLADSFPGIFKSDMDTEGRWFFSYFPGHMGTNWALRWMGAESPRWDIVQDVLTSFSDLVVAVD